MAEEKRPEAQTAQVIMVDMPGMTAEQYDKVAERHGTARGLPDGCLVHIAGPGPEGWRTVAVWESTEKLYYYVQNTLRPIQTELGIAGPSKVVTWNLYDLLK